MNGPFYAKFIFINYKQASVLCTLSYAASLF